MKYGPTSEQEVGVLFALLLPYLPTRFELDEVREQFPDCLASHVEPDGTRSPVRIEFELYASNFRLHGHDPNGCDLIVCWEDDLPSFVVPRLELRSFAESALPPVVALPVKFKYEATVWKEPTFLAECPPEDRSLHARFLTWAKRREKSFSARARSMRQCQRHAVARLEPANELVHVVLTRADRPRER